MFSVLVSVRTYLMTAFRLTYFSPSRAEAIVVFAGWGFVTTMVGKFKLLSEADRIDGLTVCLLCFLLRRLDFLGFSGALL